MCIRDSRESPASTSQCSGRSEMCVANERRVRKTSLKQGSWSSKKEGVSETSACVTGWRILYDWRQSTLDGTQRRRMRNVYTCVCVLNYQSHCICEKCRQDARGNRAKQALSNKSYWTSLWYPSLELWNISHSKIIIVFGFVTTIYFVIPLDRAFFSLSNGMQHEGLRWNSSVIPY